VRPRFPARPSRTRTSPRIACAHLLSGQILGSGRWRIVGGALETLRVYLAGKVCVEGADRLVPERRLPGGQGRLVFAYLAAEHERAVHRDELADALWQGAPPRAWEAALGVVVSKLRAVLEEVGLDGSAAVSSALGCYQIRFPPGTWIDLEAAADAAHLAERALRAGRPDEANGWTLVASSIARRPF